MTLTQFKTYVTTAVVPIEILQNNHSGHVLKINGHALVLTPHKFGSLDKKQWDELIQNKYLLTPEELLLKHAKNNESNANNGSNSSWNPKW